jgi:hypothetical protein
MGKVAAIIGGIVGLLLVLAAIFNWAIVPIPSDVPSVGTGGRGMAPGVRAMVGIVGAILAVLAVLVLGGVIGG